MKNVHSYEVSTKVGCPQGGVLLYFDSVKQSINYKGYPLKVNVEMQIKRKENTNTMRYDKSNNNCSTDINQELNTCCILNGNAIP